MQEITGYLYTNWVECQINDSSTTNIRNRIVYARPIQLYKNIDNTLKFVFKNQDQKRVYIDGYTFTMYIFNTNSLSVNQVVTNATTSIAYDDAGTVQTLDDNSTLFQDGASLLTIPLTVLDDGSTSSAKGVASVTITSEQLSNLTTDSYYYSIRADIDSSETIVYSDDNFGVRGTVNILAGHYPA
jgi:hypothetical protein